MNPPGKGGPLQSRELSVNVRKQQARRERAEHFRPMYNIPRPEAEADSKTYVPSRMKAALAAEEALQKDQEGATGSRERGQVGGAGVLRTPEEEAAYRAKIGDLKARAGDGSGSAGRGGKGVPDDKKKEKKAARKEKAKAKRAKRKAKRAAKKEAKRLAGLPPDEDDDSEGSDEEEQEDEDDGDFSGKGDIHILAASNLPKVDRWGSIDPYLKVIYDEVVVGQSHVKWKSQRPRFDFHQKVDLESGGTDAELVIEVRRVGMCGVVRNQRKPHETFVYRRRDRSGIRITWVTTTSSVRWFWTRGRWRVSGELKCGGRCIVSTAVPVTYARVMVYARSSGTTRLNRSPTYSTHHIAHQSGA